MCPSSNSFSINNLQIEICSYIHLSRGYLQLAKICTMLHAELLESDWAYRTDFQGSQRKPRCKRIPDEAKSQDAIFNTKPSLPCLCAAILKTKLGLFLIGQIVSPHKEIMTGKKRIITVNREKRRLNVKQRACRENMEEYKFHKCNFQISFSEFPWKLHVRENHFWSFNLNSRGLLGAR